MPGKYEDASLRTIKGTSPTFRNQDVYIAPSNFLRLNNAVGSGLYASRSYDKGDVIQEYIGKRLSITAANKKKTNRYMFDVKHEKKSAFVIDSYDIRNASAIRYVNSIQHEGEEKKFLNTKFVQHNKQIFLVAIKSIKKDQEMVTYYGKFTQGIINP